MYVYTQKTYTKKKIMTIERMLHFGMSFVCTVKKKKFSMVYSRSPVSHCHSESSPMIPLLKFNIYHG